MYALLLGGGVLSKVLPMPSLTPTHRTNHAYMQYEYDDGPGGRYHDEGPWRYASYRPAGGYNPDYTFRARGPRADDPIHYGYGPGYDNRGYGPGAGPGPYYPQPPPSYGSYNKSCPREWLALYFTLL